MLDRGATLALSTREEFNWSALRRQVVRLSEWLTSQGLPTPTYGFVTSESNFDARRISLRGGGLEDGLPAADMDVHAVSLHSSVDQPGWNPGTTFDVKVTRWGVPPVGVQVRVSLSADAEDFAAEARPGSEAVEELFWSWSPEAWPVTELACGEVGLASSGRQPGRMHHDRLPMKNPIGDTLLLGLSWRTVITPRASERLDWDRVRSVLPAGTEVREWLEGCTVLAFPFEPETLPDDELDGLYEPFIDVMVPDSQRERYGRYLEWLAQQEETATRQGT